MKRIVVLMAALYFTFGAVAAVHADELTDSKRADIAQLLKITGSMEVGQLMADAFVSHMSQTLKAARPDLDPALFDVMREEVNQIVGEKLPTLMDEIIPLYHKHFTSADIKELLAFYQTPIGQKTIQVMPLLTRESMQIGQQWGMRLGPEIERRVKVRFKDEGVNI